MIKIVTDTSTLFSAEEGLKIGLHVVPLNITIDDSSYRDLEDITSEELLEKIAQHHIPRTSQPSIGEKIDLYNELSQDNEVIDITLASGLSGTYHTALMAKESSEHPERIHIVDAFTLCGPHRQMALKALEMANNGAAAEEIIAYLEDKKQKETSFLIPLDFQFLLRGGRINGVAAKLGGLLKLIPVMKKGENGKGLDKFTVARTMTKAISSIIEDMQNCGVTSDYNFYISHAENIELAEKIKEKLTESFAGASIEIYNLSPSFITQGGPGCVAIQAIEK